MLSSPSLEKGFEEMEKTEPLRVEREAARSANAYVPLVLLRRYLLPGCLAVVDSARWVLMRPEVVDLIYWRDIKKSAVVFGSMLVLLLSLALFSVLSVIAYLSLATLTVTVTFRIYKNVLGAVQKTGEGHPFKQYLEMDIALPEDKVHELADLVMTHVSCIVKELRRLFLVEDFVDSLKFGLLLWVLTYIGAWFNGMTLLILGIVGLFTLPKVYETYKVQIDHYLDLAKTQIRNVIKQVQEKIPLPGKKKPE
ncbi:hypothetical protein CAPTEDRAFT_163753 [Capitella teleta]|uniref:Reticulon-like protein n=1 Tax=Capitella teleta TaxID=283909 RepID=R7TJW9_CAPTE|nr:hypothetical protein CAPTEDRAFT_163753 [Capitella teleta]|eukprot:ELT94128.1 hypothetical protein CAPTEDRAFT_163753 [Capitella teleta]